MATIENIYRAAQIGRSIGDPIGQGLQRGYENEQEKLERELRKQDADRKLKLELAQMGYAGDLDDIPGIAKEFSNRIAQERKDKLLQLNKSIYDKDLGVGIDPISLTYQDIRPASGQGSSLRESILSKEQRAEQDKVQKEIERFEREAGLKRELQKSEQGFKAGESEKGFERQKTLAELLEEKKKAELTKKSPTKEQQSAGGFANRLTQAQEVFNALESEDYNPSSLNPLEYPGQSLANLVTGVGEKIQSIPLVGGFIPDRPNVLSRATAQRFDQAKRNFINAVLRRESGAVISPEEFKQAGLQYFPQVGDSPDVIKQKKQNRETVLRSFLAEGAGRPVVEEESLQEEKSSKSENTKLDPGWKKKEGVGSYRRLD